MLNLSEKQNADLYETVGLPGFKEQFYGVQLLYFKKSVALHD